MQIKAQLFTGWHEQLLRLIAVQENRLDWFHLQEGQHASLKPDSTGVIRSQIFPGLWLLVTPLPAGDLVQVLAILQEDCRQQSIRLL